MCGGENVKDWEGLGKSLSIPEAKLEEISLTHKEDGEKSKEHLFKVGVVHVMCGPLVSNDLGIVMK